MPTRRTGASTAARRHALLWLIALVVLSSAGTSTAVAAPKNRAAKSSTTTTTIATTTTTVPPQSTTVPPSSPTPALSVLWSADHTTGDLSQWYSPQTTSVANYGGGEFNTGFADTVHSPDRGGSAKMTWTKADPAQSGTRMFRWKELWENREVYDEAWMFIPSVPRLTGDVNVTGKFWIVKEWKSRNQDQTRNDASWLLEAIPNGSGGLTPRLGWWYGAAMPGPHAGESGYRQYQPAGNVTFPIGQWFKLRTFIRQSSAYDGVIRIWLNDVLIHEQTSVKTGFASTAHGNAWAVDQSTAWCSYSDGIDPGPFSIYLDDARIEVAR